MSVGKIQSYKSTFFSQAGILLLLKRRLSNIKPVLKRQGPVPSRGKKKLKFDTGDTQHESVKESEPPATSTDLLSTGRPKYC